MREHQTLDELDPPAWGQPTSADTGLVVRCHKLRRKPLDDFAAGDLRVMIDQEIALLHLVPFALDVLEANPLMEGDAYPGDLMRSVLTVDAAYWQEHEAEWLPMHAIVDGFLSAVEELSKPIEAFRG